MKKVIILLGLLVVGMGQVYAIDACDKFVPQEASFMGKASFASNLRDFPCTYKSSIHGATVPGEVYQIVRKVDGYYEIQHSNGNKYWVWDQSIVKTDLKVNTYSLTSTDRIIVRKILFKLNNLIEDKGFRVKVIFEQRLIEILNRNNLSNRIRAVLENLLQEVQKIEKKEDQITTVSSSVNLTNTSYDLNSYNIDINKVKQAWIGWYNSVRTQEGKHAYKYDSTLEKTALDWSKTSKARGEMTHKRSSGDVYYDYNKITSWFEQRGVVCKNINRATHTENIGWGQFSCKDGECSDELIGAIRKTFDFYMSEKGLSYPANAHYLSIVHNYFTIMGLGIELQKIKEGYFKYYLTVHYCTELVD